MGNNKLVWYGLCLIILFANRSNAEIIANYGGEFVNGTASGQTRAEVQNDGWNYLWNSQGEIGNPANYTALVWNVANNRYATTAGSLPAPVPGIWLRLSSDKNGNPGDYAGHTVSGTVVNYYDRFAISAYTIQAGERGLISIVDSSIKLNYTGTSPDADGVELRVYVNSTLITSFFQLKGDASSFNVDLGLLDVGDVVYVAVGPRDKDSYDSFVIDYKLNMEPAPIPEPITSVTLFTAGIFGLICYAWRTQK